MLSSILGFPQGSGKKRCYNELTMKKLLITGLIGAAAITGISVASAQEEIKTNTAYPTSVTSMPKIESGEDSGAVQGTGKEYLSCMSRAVDTRESALISALQTYQSTVISARTAYKSTIVAAWNSSEDKNTVQTALKTAEKNLKDSMTGAEKVQNTAKESAQKQFNADRTACLKLSTTTVNTNNGANPTVQSLLEMIKKLQAQIKELTSGNKQPVQQPTIQRQEIREGTVNTQNAQ